jgi:predicted TIM-barrel fold metal-dependent hydrolase
VKTLQNYSTEERELQQAQKDREALKERKRKWDRFYQRIKEHPIDMATVMRPHQLEFEHHHVRLYSLIFC